MYEPNMSYMRMPGQLVKHAEAPPFLARLPDRDEAMRRFLGVPQLYGERGYTTTERRCARPTIEINGINSLALNQFARIGAGVSVSQ